jgi:hypothetical protein
MTALVVWGDASPFLLLVAGTVFGLWVTPFAGAVPVGGD